MNIVEWARRNGPMLAPGEHLNAFRRRAEGDARTRAMRGNDRRRAMLAQIRERTRGRDGG